MKRTIYFFFFIFVIATNAFAGILQEIGTAAKTIASSGSLWAGLVALALVYIFKAIPNQKIYDFVLTFFQKLGIVMTLGLTKWKWSAPLWNVTIEPYFVDLIENIIGAAIKGFIAGLRSDNDGTS